MAEVLNRKYTPPDNSEGERQQEAERKSQEYLKLAKENPYKLTEEIKKNPKTEPLLRQILWDTEYERIKDLNPNKLSEDTNIAKMQWEIYSFVDINPETDRNPTKDKFIKWLIDSIIVGNAELAMKIIETKWAILKNMIQEIFSWEWLKNIAEWFWKSVMELFSGDAYKTGKSLGELGLITVGSWAGWFVLKRLWKWMIKTGEDMTKKLWKETIVSQGLQKWWKGVEVLWKVVQAPYNIVEAWVKKVWWAIRDGVRWTSEAIGNISSVQKVAEPLKRVISESKEKLSEGSRRVMEITKERAKEVLSLASVPILVGSKDGIWGIWKLRGQIWAVGNDISKIKPFDKENWKSVVEESKVSEKLNSERKVIDIPKIVISFEEFEKLPWWWNLHSKEDLLQMYNNYKEFISLSPEQQSARIYKLHTFLNKETLWRLTYHDVLWAGNWWIVIKDLSNSQLAFKVNENVAKWVIEVNTHNRVVALIEAANAPDGSILRMQYKKDYGVDIIWKPPANVDVPRIGRSDKWQFTMKAIDWESVLTKMFSEKQWFEWYEWVLESVKRSYPQ